MKSKLWIAIALVLGASGAIAQDIRLIATTAREALNRASLLRALDETAVPQDYIAAARADYRRLLTALYAEGYYGGTISITIDGAEAANLAPLAAPASIGEIVITVDAGVPFTFGEVAIAPLPPAADIPADLGPRVQARSGVIRAAAQQFLRSWRDLGYPLAQLDSQQIIARHPDAKLDVTIGLDPGPQLRFSALEVSGNRRVRSERVRAIAGLPEGAIYSPAAVDQAQARLRRTGTFNSVSLITADQAGPGDTIGLRAQLDEAKRRRIGFGLELSSVEGVTVSSFWLHRNLLGGAERLRVEAVVSQINADAEGMDYALRGSFGRPATFGPDTDFFINAEASRQDEDTFLIDAVEVETGLTWYLRDDLTLQGGIGVLTAREDTDLGKRDYTLLTLPLRATLDRRDAPSDASAGYYLDARVTPFASFDRDLDGARFYGDARVYRSFGADDGFTLAARGLVGSLLGAPIAEAPADFLYFSGGGGTVRGQPYQSLGVQRQVGGQTVTSGGASFLAAQLEARYAIRDKIALVGFYDTGFVGETAIPGETGDWHAGAGVGLRYKTGIGPIRLDIGTPASGDDAGDSVQVYIGIGQAF
ncbi:autotransporter assembly complex protein TamA [Yoonia vestfoldensis]|uniref:Translocation and assembly module TamA n=1 Tax=Yoonia vestfoldensis TaxID=245188 RepID=A0A1Y0E7A8_9RHOB|nr:BamA/TamA family outer membrane protein [Yoonia vestfoldensis]ART99505.1 translocation and assembly module TamA [Yoonia vestfoldensis]